MSVAAKPVRCAVYTRKSTEDGLEQEFNSLHAQREACEAYIMSQRHEGWTVVPDQYDDGGFSGGSMARPGLQRLLADIEAGQVDVIVVYKVDRLTRSLADFAKIVERLDEKQASFVSVTQSFNTTTSMGRLTLNVLLSFAQFEREVTGERIRDKIAASKKKGIWMGGPVPLGYVVKDRKLVVEPAEAEQVRHIMIRYIDAGSAPALIAMLRREGVRTKVQHRTSGPHRGGIPFRRGSLFHLLKNPIYRGMIVHKGQVYPGEHEAIVDDELWDAVQSRLREKAPSRRKATNDRQQAMLAGRVFDAEGRPMVPSYCVKRSRRYCYYETRSDLAGMGRPTRARVQMAQLDSYIVCSVHELLGDQHRLRRISGIADGAGLNAMFVNAERLDKALHDGPSHTETLRSLVQSVHATRDQLLLKIDARPLVSSDVEIGTWDIVLPPLPRKPFREAKVIMPLDNQHCASADPKLVELLRDAAKARALVESDPELPLHRIAGREGRCRKQMTQLLRLSWLSPRIVDAVAVGDQPKSLTRQRLMAIDVPHRWQDQEALLGLA